MRKIEILLVNSFIFLTKITTDITYIRHAHIKYKEQLASY